MYSCSIPSAERAGDSQSLAMRLPWIISDEHFAFREGYKMLKRAFPRAASAVITRRTDNKEDTTVHVPIIAGRRAPAGSSRSPALIAYADNGAPSTAAPSGSSSGLPLYNWILHRAGGREVGVYFHFGSQKTNTLLLWIICFMQVSNGPA